MPKQSAAALVKGLNGDMNLELGTVIRYLVNASTVRGLLGHEARELFLKEAAEELQHATFFADKVVALGGTPSITLGKLPIFTDARKALQYEYEHELGAVEEYTKRIAQADKAGEIGLRVRIEEILADEQEHAESLARLLR